ncbi:protein-glutamate O-methyltransferase CheR [Gracilibacillus sp. S3-1-1]|uniref:Protein-glutamate O-methyltransferase CheR n=1 Tax=Gracilibacillus pellucidus TaxID=3095368 RepID=A0ACC6M584_9BACI|nr:protein-glutamate O-methyltransferase CheR [Gracilibacillus sp. S3-1-1]MDX8046120.1 protein-glutamate O-methyltransferase CheR [Gracilibacillus sp. S3-1-1]
MTDYPTFIEKIHKKTGLDLSLYKEVQMKRRLTSLRNKRGFHSFNDYFQAINNDLELLQEFLDKVTINVSEFYRNPVRWRVLEDKLLPPFKKSKKKIKIWSAACSTGEEPYTLAIIANQFWDLSDIEITATDIDPNVLARAKQGIYNSRALQEVPEPIKQKYFHQEGDTYRIDERLKQTITFKEHNLLADQYPKEVDLIVCRNVLIYFTEEAKTRIYHQFSDALTNDGIFFVGSTEQIFSPERYGLKALDTFFYEKNKN